MPFGRSIFAVALLAAAAGANAQLTLYEHENFAGQTFEIYDSTPDLANSGINDKASSVVVRDGSWQLCEHAHFAGRCVTLTRGSYPSLNAMSMNDVVSSVRLVSGYAGRPPIAVQPPVAGSGPGGRIVLYEGVGFAGRSVAFDRAMVNLENVGLNDRAGSAVVYEGNWELCEHGEFRGNCQVFAPGRYNDLGGLTGRLSSLRPAHYGVAPPVAVVPPVGPPGYAPGWGREVRVILYEGANFSGRQLVIDRPRIRNFADIGFNDRASSIRVERGYWMFCSDADFEGECRTFGPGDYPYLQSGLNNRISSGRRISDNYPYNQNPNWDGYRQ